jgi:type I restriction enzyme, S subunit
MMWSPVKAWLTEHAVGQTMLNLNTEIVSRLPIDMPPLGEQRKIAAILASVDETIEKTEAVIAQLQAVKQAMMQELLTRGLPGSHTRFKQTELGEIPEEWQVCQLHELVSCCDYGLSTSLSQDSSLTPILRMGNLSGGEVVLDDLKYVNDELPLAKGLHLEAGDILFNRTNSAALVGKVAIFRGAEFRVTFASYLLRMKSRAEHANSEWLNYVLNASRNQERLRALATPGVSQANINRSRLLALTLAVPRIEEQSVIAKQLAAVDRRIQSERSTMTSLADLKQALMSVLLTGEVRVTPSEDTP